MVKPISRKTRRRIQHGLRNWDNPNSYARKRHEAAMLKLNKALKPLEDAIERSQRLTAADFGIIVY